MPLGLLALAAASGIAAVSTACGVNMVFTMRASADHSSKLRAGLPYLLGSAMGAITVGIVLSLVGRVISAFVPAIATGGSLLPGTLATLGLLLGLREFGIVSFNVPQRNSQLNYAALAGTGVSLRMLAFGFWLGVGFLTFSPYAGLHLLGLATILLADPLTGAVFFGAFGIARALTVISLGLSAGSWEDAASLADLVAAKYNLAHRLIGGTLLAVAGLASLGMVAR